MAAAVAGSPTKSLIKGGKPLIKKEVFSSFYNPYSDFLLYIKKLKGSKPRLPPSHEEQAWELFSQWIVENKPEVSLRTSEAKKEAFLLATKCRSHVVREICYYSYDLGSQKEMLKEHETFFKENKMYIEMSHWVTVFSMQDEFPDESFIIPLILLNNQKAVTTYLKKANKDIQMRVAKFIDDLLQSPNLREKIAELHAKILGFSELRNGHPVKPINKFCLRSMLHNMGRTFKIPMAELPGLLLHMKWGFAKTLIRDWQLKKLSHDGLREQLVDIASGNDELKILILEFLQLHDDDEAAYWASQYNIPLKSAPEKKNPPNNVTFNDDEFYTVDNLDEMIEYIDSPSKTTILLDYLSKIDPSATDIVVGIDSEWKPTHCHEENPPSLLQIAFNDKIFVIDFQALSEEKTFWMQLNRQLLQNTNILKLGYAIVNDKTVFRNTPGFSFMTLSGESFMDLEKSATFLRPLVDAKRVSYPYTPDEKVKKNMKGLQLLTCQCLGKPLDKRETLSNWGQRPLRKAQKHYAALDAYILVKIYKIIMDLKNNVSESDVAFVQKHNQVMKERNLRKRSQKKSKPPSATVNGENSGSVKTNSDRRNNRRPKRESKSEGGQGKDPSSSKTIQEKPVADNVKNTIRPFSPFSVCQECSQEHNTRKCPERVGIYREVLNLFKNLQKLTKTCNFDEICLYLKNTFESIYPNKKVNFPELGWVFIIPRRMLHSPYIFVSKTYLRSPAMNEFLFFYCDLCSLLEQCCKLFNKYESDREQTKRNVVSESDACNFCFKTGHKSVNCYTKKNIITAKDNFTALRENISEAEKVWIQVKHFDRNAIEKFEKAMLVPEVKKRLKAYPKCSFCHLFGHFDVRCRKLDAVMDCFNNSLQGCAFNVDKCLYHLDKVLS